METKNDVNNSPLYHYKIYTFLLFIIPYYTYIFNIIQFYFNYIKNLLFILFIALKVSPDRYFERNNTLFTLFILRKLCFQAKIFLSLKSPRLDF